MKKLVIAYYLTICALCTVNAQSLAVFPAHKSPIIVIAHRGDHTRVPENTIASFQHAISVGADYVEVDLRTTKDGRLVIMHDETVDRMTNGTGMVKDLSFAAIRLLKVVDKSKPESPSFRVPTFEEVLKTCKGKINIYLDFKDADVETVYSLLKSTGMDKQVVVYLNAESHYYDWKKAAPAIPLISSLPGNKRDSAHLKQFLEKFKVSAVDGSPGDYDKETISLIQSSNVAVWLDVQKKNETPEYWNEILETKVNGMQSDHPGDLIKFLKERGLH